MKRKILMLMLILCFSVGIVMTSSASANYLVDGADLLTDTETVNLETELSRISNHHNVDIVIVTINSLEGQKLMDLADEYYDSNGYRADSILLLVSLEDSDWWVSTTGYGITAITDAGLEYMSNRFVPYFSDEKFAEGFDQFADLCDEFIAQAKTGNPYDIHNLPKDPFRFMKNLIIALVIGVVAAWFTTGRMKAKLKTVHQQVKANDYIVPDSLKMTKSRDFFLYKHLERREKIKSSSGSSTHTSSSRTTHGGGGGKF